MGKSFLRHEEDKMSNDFENSQEYRRALEIAKKQQELYKNVTKAISPEALAKFQDQACAPIYIKCLKMIIK